MNDTKNILDAPLTAFTTPGLEPDYTAASTLDYSVNIFLLVISGLAGTSALVDIGYGVFLVMTWNLVLGGYQLLSALVGAIRGNRKKAYYLAGAIAYLILIFGTAAAIDLNLERQVEMVLAGIFFIGLPIVGAVYYTLLCLEAKNRSRY